MVAQLSDGINIELVDVLLVQLAQQIEPGYDFFRVIDNAATGMRRDKLVNEYGS